MVHTQQLLHFLPDQADWHWFLRDAPGVNNDIKFYRQGIIILSAKRLIKSDRSDLITDVVFAIFSFHGALKRTGLV